MPKGDQAIVHVLNRIGFGPRPGDVEKVRTIGLQRYIDEQLRPERLADTSMNARLRGLTTIGLSAGEIAERYERPGDGGAPRAPAERQGRRARAGTSERRVDPIRQQANSVVVELAEQKVLRAVYSERQLQEVLTDFWFNHFNVDARKNRDAVPADRVRARRHPPARARQVPRSARSDREGSGDALLSRQLDERGGDSPACPPTP